MAKIAGRRRTYDQPRIMTSRVEAARPSPRRAATYTHVYVHDHRSCDQLEESANKVGGLP